MFETERILAFHQTSDNYYPGINNIRPGYFFGILKLFRDMGYRFWYKETESTENTLVLTFDDGYADNFDVLDKLCDNGITPIVFIPTDYIEKQNSWEYSSRYFPARHFSKDQIKTLSNNGVVFGSHGVSHQALTGLSLLRANEELKNSKRILEDIAGQEIDLVSYPFGRFNNRINELAKRAGYKQGFALGQPNTQDTGQSGFVRYRTPIYSIDDYYSLRAKCQTHSKIETLKSNIINLLAGGTIITKRELK